MSLAERATAVITDNRRPDEFPATMRLTNVSRQPWVGWTGTLTIVLAAPVRLMWGATFTASGSKLTVTPAADRATVNVGDTTWRDSTLRAPA